MMPQIILVAFPGTWGTGGVTFETVGRIGRGQVKPGRRMDGIDSLLMLYASDDGIYKKLQEKERERELVVSAYFLSHLYYKKKSIITNFVLMLKIP